MDPRNMKMPLPVTTHLYDEIAILSKLENQLINLGGRWKNGISIDNPSYKVTIPTTLMAIHPLLLRVTFALLVSIALSALIPPTALAADNSNSVHNEPSLSNIDTYDVIAIALVFAGLTVSSAGGMGGGVFIVPALVLIIGFDLKRATPISNVAIRGGAAANAWFNLRKRHPFADRPLIDSEIALGMIPVVIGGTVLGALINKLVPEYVLSLLFVVVLATGASRTMKKGIHLHKKEVASKEAVQKTASEALVSIPVSPGAYVQITTPRAVDAEKRLSLSVTNSDAFVGNSTAGDEIELSWRLVEILKREKSFAWGSHSVILICYLGVVAASIAETMVNCGGVAYWGLVLAQIPWIAMFVILSSRYLHKVYLLKKAVKYPYLDGDIQWTKKMVIFFPLGCAAAGIVAGLFGVGGAIVASPILLELGSVPEVASSTTALMILYSSAAATVEFAVFKMITWDWALLLCGVAFVVTSLSQIVILGFVRRTGRQSIIVLCFASAVVLGCITMTYQAIKTTIEDAGDPVFIDICS
ncbi:hypothetical protein CCR75_007198 [Bremia lactucae]|uniref:Sulfite exporter TauE/SafE n=1 Tax=Bremia lactucae TaxID=4779 RepID=A0A976FG15_BRELC|nr:hypothetical protein CCR75_007198 [Bremia lactucae]